MGIVDTISTLAQLPTLLKLKKGMQPRAIDEKDCLGAQVEENARQFGQSNAIILPIFVLPVKQIMSVSEELTNIEPTSPPP